MDYVNVVALLLSDGSKSTHEAYAPFHRETSRQSVVPVFIFTVSI